jgi:hypothetical protein
MSDDELRQQFEKTNVQFENINVQFEKVSSQFEKTNAQFEKIDAQFENLREDMRQIETNLLTAFHNWARPMEIRQRNVSNAVSDYEERLSLVEERLRKLESNKK